MNPTATFLIIGCVAATVAAGCAGVGAWLVRGSTAWPAAVWGVAAAAVLAAELGCRAAGSLTDPAAAAALRLVAGALALCPTMSLLGAKRPQHGVWQFIVATLAVVLALPAATATLVRPGTPPDVHVLGRWFLLLLVAVGWLNFVATRHGLAATLVAAGQLLLLRDFLPPHGWPPAGTDPRADAAGCVLLGCGATAAAVRSAAAAWSAARSRGGPLARDGESLAARIDPPWLALRETLGAAWTLRIAERFDAIAVSRGWPCRLRFAGFHPGPGDEGGPADAAVARLFRALLRRFVSDAWLHRHGWRCVATGPDGGGPIDFGPR